MELLFLPAIFMIAYLYSSVGHGGASGYLALMAFFSIQPDLIRSSALILNLFVAGIAFIIFYRAGYYRWKIVIPFLIASIPFAFIGALIKIDPHLYRIILGALLLVAVLRLLVKFKDQVPSKQPSMIAALPIGATLGLISGIIGIGGGVLLSPLLLLMKWANIKEAASASALFILLNSASGILSLSFSGQLATNPDILPWVFSGVAGALAGSYSGGYKLSVISLKYVLAVVLLLASVKLIIL